MRNGKPPKPMGKFIPHLGSMADTSACSKNLFSGKGDMSKMVVDDKKPVVHPTGSIMPKFLEKQ